MNAIAPSGYKLSQAMAAFQSLASRLEAAPDTDADGLALALQDAEADVYHMLRLVIRAHIEADAMAGATAERIKDLAARKARYEARAETLKGVAFAVLDALGPDVKGKTRFVDPEFTASVSAGQQRVIITNESAIPLRFQRQTYTVDKPALNAAVLKDGEIVPGCEVTNSLPSLSIRTK
jgi:hypothetical protein